MRMAPLVGPILVLLSASCAGVPPAMQGELPRGGAPHGGVVAGAPADGPRDVPGAPDRGATIAAPSPAKTLAGISDSPTAASQPTKKDSVAPGPTKQKALPPLDLTSLEKRLRATEAIGELAKIALKNQVDDLLNQFRAFHQGKLKTTLAELRRPYDLLVLKVLSLLGDADPSLAAAIVASREAIWAILVDPAKFAAI
jgi:hypothetical protein